MTKSLETSETSLIARIDALNLSEELTHALHPEHQDKIKLLAQPIAHQICEAFSLKCKQNKCECDPLVGLFSQYLLSCFQTSSPTDYQVSRKELCVYFYNDSIPLSRVVAIIGEFQNHAIEQVAPLFKPDSVNKVQMSLLKLFNLDLQLFCEFYAIQQQETQWVDPLTSLMNEKAFDLEFDRIISMSGRLGLHTSLLIMTIVDFDLIVEEYGEQDGKDLVQIVADSLLKHTRMSDYVARLYDGKFAIILPNTPLNSTDILCERLITKIESTSTLPVSLAIGGGEFTPDRSKTLEDVFFMAQERMQQAEEIIEKSNNSEFVISDTTSNDNVVHLTFGR